MDRQLAAFGVFLVIGACSWAAEPPSKPNRATVLASLKKGATYYREQVALRGGYVYYYSEDLQRRVGEGDATATQIWVQPPGTPTVGQAYLAAYEATGDAYYLAAATEAAEALMAGQLKSGGWSNKIDFDPVSKDCGLFRNGRGNPKGKNLSTLDDNATQAALAFLLNCDSAHQRRNDTIHEAAAFALKSLLSAQYANGGFPQVWSQPAEAKPVVRANYPNYDWRTENRIKDYWNLYTLNDGLCGDVAAVLVQAEADEKTCRAALTKLGDFLILAQMPEPQPAWAQQYNFEMQPAWARKFEPPAIAGRESEDAIETLLNIASLTRDEKYLEPVPRALAYLRTCELPDGKLARFYELRTNKPLYFTKAYELTYGADDLPTHYGFQTSSRVNRLEKKYQTLTKKFDEGQPSWPRSQIQADDQEVLEILAALDADGRWLSRMKKESIISSEIFAQNVSRLSAWLKANP